VKTMSGSFDGGGTFHPKDEDAIAQEIEERDAASLDGEGVFSLSQLLVPMLDVLSRLEIGVGERDTGEPKFFAFLSRHADGRMKRSPEVGRALHGVIIALREYVEACRRES
jgi:hypothetical protein